MPTNILRNTIRKISQTVRPDAIRAGRRRIQLNVGSVSIEAELLATATADRIWAALPIYSSAETWGQSIHFEVPVESGREPDARDLSRLGDICFWSEDDRIIIAFGPTPISAPGEHRLPRACNVWAKALDNLSPLKTVTPGEKVSVLQARD